MIGTKLSKYELLEQIGKGGFGEVYKCEHSETKEQFALKICTKNEGDNSKRFAREVRLMNDISHPNVVSIVFSNTDKKPYYFVMSLAKASLENYIDKLKNNHEFALKVFLKVCEGIKAIHNSGKFHRDIKPDNVLILKNDQIVVSDLGLGKFENRDSTILTSSNIYMGTEGYIPPEFKTARGTKNADKRGDIYQLGKMLYKILTGENPILIETRALPSPLIYIISTATKDSPKDRFQNVSELMDAVNNYLASLENNSNPIKAYESCIKTSKDLLQQGKYDESLIKQMLSILYSSKDDEIQFFEFFDKIPLEILRKLVSGFTKDFNQVFHEYSEMMFDYISNNKLGFAYVETIARIMKVIYLTSTDNEIKKNALKNNLISSVYYNRYSAMDIFDELLLTIKSEDEAKVVAEMLIEEKRWFEERIEALPYKYLHSEFQSVIDFIKEDKKTDEIPLSFDSL